LAIVPYALVITDWKLPDGNGSIVGLWATALGAKAMVISGFSQEMPGGRLGEYPTLMKPFRSHQLLAAVQESIGEAVVVLMRTEGSGPDQNSPRAHGIGGTDRSPGHCGSDTPSH
jgi:hypothetical protein